MPAILDSEEARHPPDAVRSPHWPAARATHLKEHPTCANCGGTVKLEVHHIRPFHLHPELELEPTNFITLCEAGHGGVNCHLAVGHLGSFKSFNVDVASDSAAYLAKVLHRPLAEVAA
jgi:hypothetical protein